MLISIDQTVKLLTEHDNILILMHASPDGDTIGAGHSLYYALKKMGKKVIAKCSDVIPERYSYMTKLNENEEFEPDYIVAVDTADPRLLGSYEESGRKANLSIDHHKSNLMYADNTYLDSEASSTCEIMYDVLLKLGSEITPIIADCIYTGIITDCGCFKYPNTGVNTHICAAKLMQAGANYVEINRVMFDLKTKPRVLVEQAVLNDMKFFLDDRAAVITIESDLLNATGATEDELDGIASIPRMIEGVEIGIMLRQKGPGVFKISVRTTKYVDASKLCNKFDGGGHARAAGCTINGEKDEIIAMLIKEAEKLI